MSSILTNASCLQASWILPALPNGLITRYDLARQVNSTLWQIMSISGSLYSSVVCGLAPATRYNFTLRAFTSLGGSATSDVSVGLTADAGNGHCNSECRETIG